MADDVARTDQGSAGHTAPRLRSTGNIETHFTVIAAVNLVFSIPILLVGMLLFFGGIVGGGFAEAFSGVRASAG